MLATIIDELACHLSMTQRGLRQVTTKRIVHEYGTSNGKFSLDTQLSKALAKLVNIASKILLFVSVSLAIDNQGMLVLGQEQ